MGRGSSKDWNRQRWEKETRKDFQKMRRFESAVDGYCQCITCNRKYPPGQMDGGHFIHKNAATRFVEINVQSQCRKCNYYEHGRPLEFEAFLVEVHGQKKVDELRELAKTIKVWTINELKEMRAEYRRRWKAAMNLF